MGLDIGKLFDEGIDKVKDQINAVVKTGAPAVLAGIEQYGAQQLAKMSADTKAVAQKAALDAASGPATTNPIMQEINKVLGDVGKNVVVKEYGAYIAIGIGVLIIVGMAIK